MGSPHDEVSNHASDVENLVQAQHVHGDVHIHGNAEARVSVPRQLPATMRHFVNRTVEQDALTTLLKGAGDDSTVLVSTVDGLAGVGKSTLVVQWSHRVREQFPDGELYVNLRGFDPAAEPMSPAEALAAFLSALGVAPEAMPAGEQERAAQFRTLLHGRRMLIVLDNARDTEQIRPLLPGSAGCLVVVTSRQRLDELVAQHGAHRLTLATLTGEEARKLLERYTGTERLELEPEAAEDFLKHCAGLPLALTLVGVQVAAEPDVPLEDLAADLHDEHERLDALDAAGTSGIRAVFSWSYRALSPEAARMFRLLGLTKSPDISSWAAAALAGVEQRRARRVLAELCRAHLLNRHSGERYVFHDLLRAYARERANGDDTEEERTAALQRLLDHHLYTTYAANQRLEPERQLPDLEYTDETLWRDFQTRDEAVAWWDAERAGVQATIDQAVALGLPRGPLLAHAAVYLFKLRGLVAELKDSVGVGLKGVPAQGDRCLRARLLGDLGAGHLFSKEHEAALPYFEATGELYAEMEDGDWEATSHIAVGMALLGLGRYEEAVNSARQALHLEALSEGPPLEKGGADAVLGLACANLGDFATGFAHLQHAVDISAGIIEKAGALDNLGSAYRIAGDVDNAVRTYRQAVEHNRQGGNRLGEASSLNELADALHASGDLEEARSAWDAALVLFDEFSHPAAENVRSRLNELDAAGQE